MHFYDNRIIIRRQYTFAKYIYEVNKEIIATRKEKQKLFGDLKSDIHDRIADGKIANYDDIIAHFGTPAQVAKDFFATANIKEIKRKLLLRRIVTASIIGCSLIWFAYHIVLTNDGFNKIHTYTLESFEVDGSMVYENKLVEDNRHDWSAIFKSIIE